MRIPISSGRSREIVRWEVCHVSRLFSLCRRVASSAATETRPNGCALSLSQSCSSCLRVPNSRTSVVGMLQAIVPRATAASAPSESISCLRILAAAGRRLGIRIVRWRTLSAMRATPAGSTPMRCSSAMTACRLSRRKERSTLPCPLPGVAFCAWSAIMQGCHQVQQGFQR